MFYRSIKYFGVYYKVNKVYFLVALACLISLIKWYVFWALEDHECRIALFVSINRNFFLLIITFIALGKYCPVDCAIRSCSSSFCVISMLFKVATIWYFSIMIQVIVGMSSGVLLFLLEIKEENTCLEHQLLLLKIKLFFS